MDASFNTILWKQFGAAIDMLENAMVACPEEVWSNESKFWYISYHTLFCMDYYFSDDPRHFMPPPPFTLSELDPSGILPERVYSKEELLQYLQYGRKKAHELITHLTPERAAMRFITERRNVSTLENLLHNMRHIQHHTAQLNLLLRQQINQAPDWVAAAKELG